MKAKDLMIPIQDFLKPDNTLEMPSIFCELQRKVKRKSEWRDYRYSTKTEKLVGMLSMTDILKAVHPSYMFINEPQ